MVYGYCRISTRRQNIERQIRNIKEAYPGALIVKEIYTGTKFQGRKELENLLEKVKADDTIIFDSVSRMSRNADEGVKTYFDLFDKGINLIFLKERYIDTDVYRNNLKDRIELTGADEDEIFRGINNYFRKLAQKQIRIAFEQAEKEVKDLQIRTKEGIKTARLNGKQIGQEKGRKLNIKKAEPAKEAIRKYNKDFDGQLNNEDTWKLVGISKMTFYKYKREMLEEAAQ